MPEFLRFFGGRRFVPIIMSFAAIFLALIFSVVWSPIQAAINSVGELIMTSGGVGAFIFDMLNRLLIPLGLHHILDNLLWFSFDEFTNPATGEIVRGDFGIPAVALAMYRTANPENRAKVAGVPATRTFTSFLTGITEPLEFSFMFPAPALYAVHAILTGTEMWICHTAGILAGFIDCILNFGIATHPELILPIGLAFGTVYYLVFSRAIVKFNLPTLGRYA